jgi:hypothetical protein
VAVLSILVPFLAILFLALLVILIVRWRRRRQHEMPARW